MNARDFYARCRAREDDDCIEWRGAAYNGRPIVVWDGRRQGAARVAYLLHYGDMPPHPLRLGHTCATDSDRHLWCVNPAHLYVTGNERDLTAFLDRRQEPKPKPPWLGDPITPADLAAVLTARKEPPGIDPREDQP